MGNFSDDFGNDDDEITDSEKQSRNNIAQEKAKQGRYDDDDSVEDLPDSAVSNAHSTSRD